jgi:excisionase family DNA binding protein
MEEQGNLISAATAAKRLNVSRTTLSRLVCSGRLAAYRIGHRTLFDQKMLEDFKASVLQPAEG